MKKKHTHNNIIKWNQKKWLVSRHKNSHMLIWNPMTKEIILEIKHSNTSQWDQRKKVLENLAQQYLYVEPVSLL